MLESLIKRARRFMVWAGLSSGIVLTAVLAVVGGVWVFAELADEVAEGETQRIDQRIVEALRTGDPDPPPAEPRQVPIGPKWLQETGRDITGLGGVAVLTLLILAVAGYLLLVRKYHAMWLVLAASLGALAISSLLKNNMMVGRQPVPKATTNRAGREAERVMLPSTSCAGSCRCLD